MDCNGWNYFNISLPRNNKEIGTAIIFLVFLFWICMKWDHEVIGYTNDGLIIQNSWGQLIKKSFYNSKINLIFLIKSHHNIIIIQLLLHNCMRFWRFEGSHQYPNITIFQNYFDIEWLHLWDAIQIFQILHCQRQCVHVPATNRHSSMFDDKEYKATKITALKLGVCSNCDRLLFIWTLWLNYCVHIK